jgi:hypothetical protein
MMPPVKRFAQSLLAAALLAGACAGALAPSAGACVLAGPPPTPDQKVQSAHVAFTGTVTMSVPQFAGGFAMTVRVDRVVKGTVPDTVQLVSGMNSCSEVYDVGERVGLAMRPETPMPWNSSTFDIVSAEALDALPLDRAFAPLAVRALHAGPALRRVQVHVLTRACTTLRARLAQTATALAITLRAADGPACTSGPRHDRCVTLTATRAVGSRAISPRMARRVATAARCPALAS